MASRRQLQLGKQQGAAGALAALPHAATVLSRAGVYYVSSFRNEAGLPTIHCLNTTAVLTAPHTSTCAFMCRVFQLRQIDACPRLRRAVPVFLSLLLRNRRCNYNHLLAAHCPYKALAGTPDAPPTESVMANALRYSAITLIFAS